MKINIALILAAGAALLSRSQADPLKVGDPAPAIAGVTDSGETISLGEVYKKQPYTLVYFYPKADTKGCTIQGCNLRDAYEELTQKGVAVIGVSHDNVAAQKHFKDKFHFPFPLIADHDKQVSHAFGVPDIKLTGLATRQAYLIKDGTVVWADYKAQPSTQAQDVLKFVAGQKG